MDVVANFRVFSRMLREHRLLSNFLSIFLAGLDLGLQAERSARNKRSEVAFLGADWGGMHTPSQSLASSP
jgi:hypothetical protein